MSPTTYLVAFVLGMTLSCYASYIGGRNNHTLAAWVYSLGFIALLVAQAAAVSLSFEWNAWSGDQTFWTAPLALAAFFAMAVAPLATRRMGKKVYRRKQPNHRAPVDC